MGNFEQSIYMVLLNVSSFYFYLLMTTVNKNHLQKCLSSKMRQRQVSQHNFQYDSNYLRKDERSQNEN